MDIRRVKSKSKVQLGNSREISMIFSFFKENFERLAMNQFL